MRVDQRWCTVNKEDEMGFIETSVYRVSVVDTCYISSEPGRIICEVVSMKHGAKSAILEGDSVDIDGQSIPGCQDGGLKDRDRPCKMQNGYCLRREQVV